MIKAIITGATGMVGEGVLHECLLHELVSDVLVINRKPCGIVHPKLKEIILEDFFNPEGVMPELASYNACFFCLGVTSLGKKEPEYFKLTYTLTLGFAKKLSAVNPSIDFCYVSGSGTDSSEKGKLMWARVKGKTENDLALLNFRSVYAFRPAVITPTKGLKNTLKLYKWLDWSLPLFRTIFPKSFVSLKELGLAMINAPRLPQRRAVLEVEDIKKLAAT